MLSFIRCGQRIQRRKKMREAGSQADLMLKRIQRRINLREQVIMWSFIVPCLVVFILLVLGVISF